jgi:CPA2 family monovalent cation:H+ antiporter-2/glutathione-regulated potassium-efflux system protein KefB
MLPTLVALLAAAAIAVPLSRRLGLGSVLGYLLAGTLIGPHGIRLVAEVDQVQEVAELGVVMLLFLIGLEVRPQRLWVMRRSVFGLGSLQVALSLAALALMAWAAGAAPAAAVVLGAGFALSSTAIVLPLLGERDLLKTLAGRDAFAVLLFQDLAFIPLVALVPLLSGADLPDRVPWHDVGRAAAAVLAVLAIGRFVVPLAFRAIGGSRTPEVFTAMALLIVLGTGFAMHEVGLSMSLGAFIAGVLLSESEYRHELRADIEPFEGLLLGFFFLSVGMNTNLALAADNPATLLAGVAALVAAKIAIGYGLGRWSKHNRVNALRFSLALPQGSEFSFVLFDAAVAAGALTADASTFATLVVAASMATTPVLFSLSEAFVVPRLKPKKEQAFEPIDAPPTPVIICGFGRMGQIVGRILTMSGVPFTALEKDSGQVDVVRRFGSKIYFGDPGRADVLRAAGAEQARLLVVVLDNVDDTLRVVEMAQRTFPNLVVLARARNRRHAYMLMDRGVEGLVRETFHSALRLSEMTLTALGVPDEAARAAVALFAEQDERNLLATHAIYHDEKQLIQSVQQATEELADLFEADRATMAFDTIVRPAETPKAAE